MKFNIAVANKFGFNITKKVEANSIEEARTKIYLADGESIVSVEDISERNPTAFDPSLFRKEFRENVDNLNDAEQIAEYERKVRTGEIVLEQPQPAKQAQPTKEVIVNEQLTVNEIVEHNGQQYRVTDCVYISAQDADEAEDGFDVFVSPGWHSTLVLCQDTPKNPQEQHPQPQESAPAVLMEQEAEVYRNKAGTHAIIKAPYHSQMIDAIKALPGAKWYADKKFWALPIAHLGAAKEAVRPYYRLKGEESRVEWKTIKLRVVFEQHKTPRVRKYSIALKIDNTDVLNVDHGNTIRYSPDFLIIAEQGGFIQGDERAAYWTVEYTLTLKMRKNALIEAGQGTTYEIIPAEEIALQPTEKAESTPMNKPANIPFTLISNDVLNEISKKLQDDLYALDEALPEMPKAAARAYAALQDTITRLTCMCLSANSYASPNNHTMPYVVPDRFYLKSPLDIIEMED